jgi:teichuronic acid exporter
VLTRNVLERTLVVAFGVGMGPLVQLIATPFLARLFTPAEFGQLALFLSSVSVLIAISCLRYELAIAVVEDESVNASVWVALSSTLVLFVVMLLLVAVGIPQALFPAFAALGAEAWGVPFVGASGGIVLVGSYLTLRQSRYYRNAAMRSAQAVLFVAVALGSSNVGLVRASIISSLIVGAVVMVYLLKVISPVAKYQIRSLGIRFRDYPLLLTPTSLLDAVALAVPVFFISTAYGLEATGQYTQIQRLIGAPLILAGVVVGQLFLKQSAELFRSGESSRPLVWKSIGALSIVALAMMAMLFIAGEPLCKVILGDAWRVDMKFLIMVATPFLFKSVISPVSTVFITHNKVGSGVKWQISYFISTITVLYFASRYVIFDSFLIIYAIHEAIHYSVYLLMANLAAEKN